MSKVQDAINASKTEAQRASFGQRKATLSKSVLRQPAALVRLDGCRDLALDPDQMERACILPFVTEKGATNAYSLLRTRLLQRMRDNQWNSLMVTGTLPNDGNFCVKGRFARDH